MNETETSEQGKKQKISILAFLSLIFGFLCFSALILMRTIINFETLIGTVLVYIYFIAGPIGVLLGIAALIKLKGTNWLKWSTGRYIAIAGIILGSPSTMFLAHWGILVLYDYLCTGNPQQ
jgi:hypothetical protein